MKKAVVYFILAFINLIFYCFKIQGNKITFISYRSDKLEKDFKLLAKNLEKEKKYKLKYILTKYENTLMGNIKYLFNCIIQVYHVNTSKVVILDYNNFVVSHFKKKYVQVIQVWHASGAIKKFGNDIKREYPIRNYNYVLSTSTYWKKIYSKAFNVAEENVLPLGIPRTDNLFSSKKLAKYKKDIFNKYPNIKGKKIVLYAPTFRGDPINDVFYQPINLDYIREQLGDEYVVIYKLHPWLQDRELSKDNNIINGKGDGIRKLFAITDFLICDYSAVIFDFSILCKPMVFFAPDLEEYKSERGMYEEYEEIMPGPICRTEDEVIESIKKNKFNLSDINKFKNKYFDYQDGMATERVSNFIKSLL